MDIAFISCVKLKKIGLYKAEVLYISDFFKKSLKYCQLNHDKIFILSAKYGLLNLDDQIEDYEMTLNNFSKNEKIIWSKKVFYQISKKINIDDKLFFYVGENYRKYLLPLIKNNYEIPLKGLGIGKQLRFYKNNIESQTLRLF